MYSRFVVSELDEDSNKELGVFHAIGHLRATGKLYSYEEIHHDQIRQWFNENLEKAYTIYRFQRPFLSQTE